MNEEQAKEHIDSLKAFYGHLASFVGVNLFLFMMNMIDSPDSIWFIYPMFGWGIGLISHAFSVFWTGPDWESRKLQELTGLSQTRDQLSELSERTDNLITILSSVNWEKVDPELMETRDKLERTRTDIARLDQGDRTASRTEVTREIEKLEAFVSSSKFDYYDLASRDKP